MTFLLNCGYMAARAANRRMTTNAFVNEDKPMLEAQQANIGNEDFDGLRPALQPGEIESARVRRRLKTLIERETI